MIEPSLTIQRLTAMDDRFAAQLDALFDDGKAWDREQGARFVRDPDTLLLGAWWDGRLRGFLTAYRLQRFDRRRAGVLLYEIGVDDRFRRHGIGTALIGEVRRWAKAVEADEVWVVADTDDPAAKAFYAATGGHAAGSDATMFTFAVD